MGADRVAQGTAEAFSSVVTGYWHAAFSGDHDLSRDPTFTVVVKADLRGETHPVVRRLSQADAVLFTQFEASASEQDLDDANVELDHWAVFGAFAQDRLVTAASMYPWDGARIADLGILTLPAHRRRGHARAVVRALGKHAAQEGYESQYRCELDNHASLAVAKAAGLTRFGTWQVWSRASPRATETRKVAPTARSDGVIARGASVGARAQVPWIACGDPSAISSEVL